MWLFIVIIIITIFFLQGQWCGIFVTSCWWYSSHGFIYRSYVAYHILFGLWVCHEGYGRFIIFLGIAATRDDKGIFLSWWKYAWVQLDHYASPVSDPTLYHSLASGLQYLTFTRRVLSYEMHEIYLFMKHPWNLTCMPQIEFLDTFALHLITGFIYIPSLLWALLHVQMLIGGMSVH